MLVDLVRIPTPDGFLLDAILQRPATRLTRQLPDAICFIHGTGSNFYSSTLFEFLAQRFLEQGLAVLRANTRGHDGISTAVTEKGGVRLGAAYETVDACRHDLTALADWLRDNVGPRTIFLGHSVGAVKCLYAAAHEPAFAGVDSLVLLSPPRLSYEWFCSGPKREEFLASYRLAEAKVQEGQGGALLDVKMPLPYVSSAASYLEKYGPEERYHFVRFLPMVRTPSLFLFGTVEVEKNVAFQQSPDLIGARKAKQPGLDVVVIPGGDHFYTGVRDAAWQAIETWLPRRKMA